MRNSLFQVICSFYSVCLYMCRNYFVYVGLFSCFVSFCISMFFLVCIYIFIKKKSVIFIYFNDLFWLFLVDWKVRVPRLYLQSLKQTIFLGDMTRLQVSLFNTFFGLRQLDAKILRQLHKTEFIRVFSQNPKASLRPPFLPFLLMLCVSNLSTAKGRKREKPLQKLVVSIYFVTR